MPNLVGTGLNQVPTNGMLGGLAYQSPYSASIKDLDLKNLSQIKSEISGTAVDVFVYDTSKDSDGGAWRKRTKDTSWYNDSHLNTSIRGSRREFPAVAVIVANAGTVKIYDGDDPDLPLWVSFPTTSAKAVTALNGELCLACHDDAPTYHGLLRINFIADRAYNHRATTNATIQGVFLRSLSSTDLQLLNDGASYFSGYDASLVPNIIHNHVNDVAMTVLPNAPIDDATGLPIPTIAVATDGGVSTIKDDGTIASTQRGSNETRSIAFDEDHSEIFSWGTEDNFPRHITRLPIESWVTSSTASTLWTNNYFSGYEEGAGSAAASTGTASGGFVTVANSGRHFGIDYGTGGNEDNRLVIFHPLNMTNNANQNLSAFVTSSYNTGYMNGNIKGAFLSDTSTTNLVATDLEIITNGSFATDSDWTKGTGWTISGGTATQTGASDIYQEIAVVTGRRYLMTVTVDLTGDSSITNTSIGFRTLANDAFYVSKTTWTANAVNRVALYWTSTVTGNILARCYSADQASLDNWSVQDVTDGNADRSVNNEGLQVFGTITKSAVATGADLVAYSGFSNSNLLLTRNSYDFGTTDSTSLCIIGWFKLTDLTGYNYIGSVANYDSTPVAGLAINSSGDANAGKLYLYDNITGQNSASGASVVSDGNWHCAVGVFDGDTRKIYQDGELVFSNSFSSYALDLTEVDYLAVGHAWISSQTQHHFSGSLSLTRFSNSIPTAEQIKKIYEDEKHLFQENAKATLYGSSDAVTALGYDEDEETLYVGTSSGRSDFRGLRRINNTTTAVTTAISASNGLVAEQ